MKIDNSSFEMVETFRYLGTTLTYRNAIQEEIKRIFKSGNACCNSVQNLFSSSLLSTDSENMYRYHCHNTKHIHVPLSQYKTYTRTTVTIQNIYTYHCHNTTHIHVQLSQYKIYTRTSVTIQNMHTYHCHNTKYIHVPLPQYKTYKRTTVTIQNI